MKVIVIGGGPTGLFFANKLSEQHPDFQISIVDKFTGTNDAYASPLIVNKAIMEKLHKEYQVTTPITKAYIQLGPLKFSSGAIRSFQKVFKTDFLGGFIHDYLAPDYNLLVNRLLDVTRKKTNIQITEGYCNAYIIEDNTVVGAKIKGLDNQEFEIRGDLLVDATGRQARVAESINKQIPEALLDISNRNQGSIVVSSYLHLDTSKLNRFADVADTIYLGFLPVGLFVGLFPAEKKFDDRQSYLLLTEGPIAAYAPFMALAAKNPQGEAVGLLTEITKNSRFVEIIANTVKFNQSSLFNYVQSEVRKSNLPGLVMIGDAKFNSNPIMSQGVLWIVESVEELLKKIAVLPTDLHKAGQEYESEQYEKDIIKEKNLDSQYRKLIWLMKLHKK